MSSLRSQILSEIKKLLNEADTGDYRDTINKVIRAPQKELTRGALGPGELFPYLDLDDVDLSFSELRTLFTGIQTWTPPIPVEAAASFRKICRAENVLTSDGDFYYIYCKNEVPCAQFKLGRKSTPVPNLLGGYRGNKARTDIRCEYSGQSPQPKPPTPEPPVPPTPPRPEPSPTPSPDQDEMSACRIAFVGKNGGQESGPLVAKVQKYLEAYSFLAKGSYTPGKLEASTDKAIKNLQRKMNEYGKKISSGVGGDYGTAKGPGMKAGDVGAALTLNPDGCYGPKTSCAATLFYGLPDIYGRSKARCAAKLKLSKEQAAAAESVVQGQISPETFVSRGLEAGKKFFGGDTEGAKQALGKTAQQTAKEKAKELGIKESKNWLDKTREETTSNLFERLVKDAASKKVI